MNTKMVRSVDSSYIPQDNPQLVARILIISLLLILISACGNTKPTLQESPWPASTPEMQGVDSAALIKMLDFNKTVANNFHSILILRHGHTILELYYPPFDVQDKHQLFSATKSVTSALIGIAVQEGKIQSLDQKVIDFFPDRSIANLDELKKRILLSDLLNMTSGLRSDELGMGRNPDWTQFTLDQGMVFEPGQTFGYNTGNTQLLSAIIQETTGDTAFTFAQEKLFAPLGISDVYWASDSSGTTQGGVGLMLTPRDMARFGDLYLHQGKWKDNQVVPAEWVQQSTISNPNGYAYQWWQYEQGFAALGYGGQIIYINPDQDLIVVMTAGLLPSLSHEGVNLIQRFILPAIKSDQALPESPDAKVLAQRVADLSNPTALPVEKNPPVASTISGKLLLLEENPIGWESLKLEFKDTESWITTKIKDQPDESTFPIGLDGLWRISPALIQNSGTIENIGERNLRNPFEYGFLVGSPLSGRVAMKGEWKNDHMFLLTVQDTRDFDLEQIEISFTTDGANIVWHSVMDQIVLRVKGKFQ